MLSFHFGNFLYQNFPHYSHRVPTKIHPRATFQLHLPTTSSIRSATPTVLSFSTIPVSRQIFGSGSHKSLLQGFNNPHPPPPHQSPHRAPSTFGPAQKAPSPPSSPPSLTAPLPSIANLTAALPSIQHPSHDPTLKLAWCCDVLFLVDRLQNVTATDIPASPITISDPQLLRLSQITVPLILQISAPQSPPQTPPPPPLQNPSTSPLPFPQPPLLQ